MPDPSPSRGYTELWDWRRRVAALYGAVRQTPDPHAAWQAWRRGRDELFRDHPQSPLDDADRVHFRTLPYFPYDPALRFEVTLRGASGPPWIMEAGADGTTRLQSFAKTDGLVQALGRELTLYWVEGYGGGVFLPFADATSGKETYGAGRYLLDTIKGADLGTASNQSTVLDFNFAYNPSCSYSPRYVCPLSRPENKLSAVIRAGEMRPDRWVVEPARYDSYRTGSA